MLALTLLIALFYFSCYTVNASGKLYWDIKPHTSLLNSFLELKIVLRYCRQVSRQLIIASKPSVGEEASEDVSNLNMCSMFNLPDEVTCGKMPANITCISNLTTHLDLDHEACYNGEAFIEVHSEGAAKSRVINLPLLYQAVEMPLSLDFGLNGSIHELVADIEVIQRTELMSPYTAVHWSRSANTLHNCKRGHDQSVNCGNSTSLVQKIKEFSSHTSVFIVTEEPSDSANMVHLRSLGYVTFEDLSGKLYETTHPLHPSDLKFVLEMKLMLNADTFLGWGNSDVNSVVEHDRMMRNMTHCVGQTAGKHREVLNWCVHTKRFNVV